MMRWIGKSNGRNEEKKRTDCKEEQSMLTKSMGWTGSEIIMHIILASLRAEETDSVSLRDGIGKYGRVGIESYAGQPPRTEGRKLNSSRT